MKTIDVTKLVADGVRTADHVRIPGMVAGESIRGDAGGELMVDWDHRCMVHFAPATEDRPAPLYTVIPFDNVMWITASMGKTEGKKP